LAIYCHYSYSALFGVADLGFIPNNHVIQSANYSYNNINIVGGSYDELEVFQIIDKK
jgi:hypothetical protein